jgi:FdhE protein
MPSYQARIDRASHLAVKHPSASPILQFYAELARFQEGIFSDLRSKNETDPRALACHFPPLIHLVSRTGTELLAAFSAHNLQNDDRRTGLLLAEWEGKETLDPPARFFARALLQPYAEYLASRGQVQTMNTGPTCPFCNARPVAGVLRGEGDGGKRWLLCSLCSTEWQFRRVLCPGCGEENKDKLPIYKTAGFPAARVEACDTCRTYLKSIDLTEDGHAIPVVDELATLSLGIWAEENGYSKLETNLLGM